MDYALCGRCSDGIGESGRNARAPGVMERFAGELRAFGEQVENRIPGVQGDIGRRPVHAVPQASKSGGLQILWLLSNGEWWPRSEN